MTVHKHSRNYPAVLLASLLLAVFIAALILFKQFLILPKMLMVVIILMVAFLLRKFRPLVRDWMVFIAFIYLFDSLRGTIYILTCKLQLPAYALYVLNIEKRLFGGVPSVALQNLLLHPDLLGNVGWLEKILTVVYGSHFIAFLFMGLMIWIYKAADFPFYKTSFYLLSGTGILFYFLVPTVPPWMAANHFGLIPPLNHFNIELFNLAIPDISNGFDTNPIAAMPSLHAGFPILCSILLWRLYRWKGAPFYIYTLSVLFAIVYTGDHYVADVMAGLVLAASSYFLAKKILKKRPANPENGSEAGASFRGAAMKRRILLGLGILLVGVVIGGINKTQFVLHANSYNLDVPKYIDFFRNEDAYRDSFPVQTYFGNHFLSLYDYRAALPYFERSLELARNPIENKEAQIKIGFCRRVLSQKD